MIIRPKQQLRTNKIGLHIYFRVLCALVLFVLVSCTHTPSLTNKVISPVTTKQTHILLVNTNRSIARYQIAETAFMKTLTGSSINAVDLGQDQQPIDTLQDLLNKQHYDAVYCIGAKALGSIDYIDPDMPVIFSSVLNWRRFNAQKNYYGIASEVAPEAQLTWFKYFFPKIKKIGVLYSSDNQKLLLDTSTSAKKLAIQLVTKKVTRDSQLASEAKALLAQVDALWLISDPVVLASTQNAEMLFKVANKKRIPIFAYNSFFVDMGAALSITADRPTTGRQAALMTKSVLNEAKNEQSVQFPAGSSITLNLDKTEDYGVELNEDALDSVDIIVNK